MINQKIIDALTFVSSYTKSTTSWLIVKKELLKSLPSTERTKFSIRDNKTKKHFINEFESSIINLWKEMTGVELRLEDHERHE